MSGPSMIVGRVVPLGNLRNQEANVTDKKYTESILLGLGVGAAAYYLLQATSTWSIALGGTAIFLLIQSGWFGGDARGGALSSFTAWNKGIYAQGTAAAEEAVRVNSSFANYYDIAAGGNTVRH